MEQGLGKSKQIEVLRKQERAKDWIQKISRFWMGRMKMPYKRLPKKRKVGMTMTSRIRTSGFFIVWTL